MCDNGTKLMQATIVSTDHHGRRDESERCYSIGLSDNSLRCKLKNLSNIFFLSPIKNSGHIRQLWCSQQLISSLPESHHLANHFLSYQ